MPEIASTATATALEISQACFVGAFYDHKKQCARQLSEKFNISEVQSTVDMHCRLATVVKIYEQTNRYDHGASKVWLKGSTRAKKTCCWGIIHVYDAGKYFDSESVDTSSYSDIQQ